MSGLPQTSLPTPGSWPLLARAELSRLLEGDQGPRRALIVGAAGSGKSTLLRALRQHVSTQGATVCVARAGAPLPTPGPQTVLAVDDAHLLDAADIAAIVEYSRDDDASVLVAMRPGQHDPSVRELAALIEQSRPAITLGHVSANDISRDDARDASPPCIADILSLCGGVSWLVFTALAVHEPGRCAHGIDHDGIRDALRDAIAHRLSQLDDDVRTEIENRCVSDPDDAPGDRRLIDAGYAAGLLERNGCLVPIVESGVVASIPVERVARRWEALAGHERADAALAAASAGTHDEGLARFFIEQGMHVLADDPARANEFFARAADVGGPTGDIALARARADLALGALDAAAAQLDIVDTDTDAASDAAAAVWAARGFAAHAAAVYRARPPAGRRSRILGAIAALAAGDRGPLDALPTDDAGPERPTTLSVALETLIHGLRATLEDHEGAGLADLVRASELYTRSASIEPTPELPAVIAAVAAINTGHIDAAHTALEQARAGRQGGPAGRDRLTLWLAWVALLREHPADAESALATATASGRPLDPRDALLASAIRVAMARRYADEAGLDEAWRRTEPTLLSAQFDLFGIHPMTEFVIAAARLHRPERVDAHFRAALELTVKLGAPIEWSAHLYWAGVQRGILNNTPTELGPYARALVSASRRSVVAATMAQAGRAWTSVLGGSVDPSAVEAAAQRLASIGLSWDGARLSGHGAARTDDRKVATRLLATARQLHPRDEATETSPSAAPAPSPAGLSPREVEVAELVLQGKTYAEIGETIFISPRTAEHHIARIRRRLGASSRSDLIAKLRIALDVDATSSSPDETPTAPHPTPSATAVPLPEPVGVGDFHRRER